MTKELQTEFIGKGEVKDFVFRQVYFDGKWYIYQVDTGNSIHYEVFQRKVNSLYNTVTYPSSKNFGIWAYTSPNYERCRQRVPNYRVDREVLPFVK